MRYFFSQDRDNIKSAVYILQPFFHKIVSCGISYMLLFVIVYGLIRLALGVVLPVFYLDKDDIAAFLCYNIYLAQTAAVVTFKYFVKTAFKIGHGHLFTSFAFADITH